MRFLKKGIIWALIMSMTVLSGCSSSIVLSGSEKIVVDVETVPETKAEKEKTPQEKEEEEKKKEEENARQLREQEQIKEYDKYNFDYGMDDRAFYLLPAGVPLPGGVINFKVLDFNNEDTFVYAYQCLYKEGSCPDKGIKGPFDDEKVGEFIVPQYPGFTDSDAGEKGKRKKYIEGPATSIKQMMSVLMSYNFETKEYEVFFKQIQPVVVKYQASEETQSVDMVIEGNHKKGQKATLWDMMPFLTMTPGNGKYVMYYQNMLYRFDITTKKMEKLDVSRDIERLCDMHEGNRAKEGRINYENGKFSVLNEALHAAMMAKSDIWSPDGLVMDTEDNIFMVVKQSKGGEVSDTEKNVDTEDTDTKQYLLSYKSDFVGNKAEDDMVIFRADNAKLDEIAAAFEKKGGSHDFGDGKPSRDEIYSVFQDPDVVIDKIIGGYKAADMYTPFRKTDVSGRKDILGYYVDGKDSSKVVPVTFDEDIDFSKDYSFDMEYEFKDEKNVSAQYGFHGVLQANEKTINKKHYTDVSRELEIIYWDEEEYTETDEQGVEHTKTRKVKRTEHMTDKASVIYYKELGFPVHEQRWFNVIESRGNIMQSPFNGITRHFSVDSISAKEEQELLEAAKKAKERRAAARKAEEAAEAEEIKREKQAEEQRKKEGREETDEERFDREEAERRRAENQARRKAEEEADKGNELIYQSDAQEIGHYSIFWNKADDKGLFLKADINSKDGMNLKRRLKATDFQFERVAYKTGAYREPVYYLTDTMSHLICYNFSESQVFDKDWATVLEVPKDDLSILHQTSDNKRLTITYQPGAIHMVNQNGKLWVYAASVTEGIVRLDLNKSDEGTDPNAKVPRLGQVSDYPYNMIFMDEMDDNRIYAIGFQSHHTGFTDKDLPVARVYYLDMYDQTAVERLIYSATQDEKNIAFRHKLLDNNDDKDWKAFLYNLKLGTGSSARQEDITEIRKALVIKWNVGWSFLRNCSMTECKERYKLLNDMEKVKAPSELADLAVLHNEELKVPEENLPITKEFNEGQKRQAVKEAKIKKMQELKGYTEETWNEMLQDVYNRYWMLN